MSDKQKSAMEEFLEDAAELEFDDEDQPGTEESSDSSQTDPDEGANVDNTELEAVTGAAGTPDVDNQPDPAPGETPSPAASQEAPAQQPATTEAPAASTEPQPAPVQPAAPPEPVAQAPEAAPATTPPAENIQEVFTDWRTKTEDLLAQHHYALSAEDMARLDTEPQEIIPRLLSKVYLDAVSASISQVVQYLPQMVRQVNEQHAVNSQSENAFFERWPDLKQHQQTVISIGQVYRQRNPQATAEQFINEVGAAAMVSLRLDPSKGQAPASQPAQAAPFVPAAQSPQGGAPKAAPPSNIFTQLDQEFSFEEDM